MTLVIDIAVEAEVWTRLPDAEDWITRGIRAAAAATGLEQGGDTEVSVLLCDDEAIRVLNRDWRDRDKPTNVLSFPAVTGGSPGGPRLLGDIAVAFETMTLEAEAEGKPVEAHLAHLVVHGFLHLLDHDHKAEAEAEAMEALETRIMSRLGLADPYAGSEPEQPTRP